MNRGGVADGSHAGTRQVDGVKLKRENKRMENVREDREIRKQKGR